MKVLLTDMRHSSADEEHKVFDPVGIDVDTTFSRNEDELIRNGRGAVGFLVSYARVTRRVMEALPDLKAIVKYGVGVDTIDVSAAHDLGKQVANVPDYCVQEVALQAMALALSALRMIHFFGQEVRVGHWIEDPGVEPLRRVSAATLGLIGFGRIARQLALYMGPMIGRVIAHDPFLPAAAMEVPPTAGRVESLERLFEESSIVSVHVPLTAQTHGMVAAAVLAHGRRVVLINTSRAAIIEREGLVGALDAGRVSFYGADTFWSEPADYSDPWTRGFLARRNVLITPHMGWYSVESQVEVRRKAAEEVLRVIQGNRPLHGL